jgi:Ni,Fe-hydrogenase III large subunit
LFREAPGEILFVSTNVVEGGYPALSPAFPLAARFERMVRDLWGHAALGGTDARPWLDHGRWPQTVPMASRPGPPVVPEPPEFLLLEDDTLDQIPLGPVRTGITAAAHLRLTVRGETIVRAEAHLGYTHKGTLSLIRGKSPRAAARFAARLVGEATVAHSIAFARATEAALGVEIPPRATSLRDLMANVEHMVAATDDAEIEEALRRAANTAFGHRLMMDCVVPGGVAANIAAGGLDALQQAMNAPVPDLPEGPVSVSLPADSGEGIGHATGPHGDIWHWLRLDHGQIASAFLCDPAWVRWPELEAALALSALDDLAATSGRFQLPASGADL